MIELFKEYPDLKNNIPHHPIGIFPTPVEQLPGLEKILGKSNIFCKNDGYSNPVYGGNKIRKLEFVFGQVLKKNIREVVTFGCVGSNHALATSINAEKLGIKCVLVLFPQPNARTVRQNILLDYKHNAELIFCDDYKKINFSTLKGVYGRVFKPGEFYIIPAGGSSVEGTVGYVNAAFELKSQIDEGLLPEPDIIFLPLGTMGTAVGLTLGLKTLGLKTKVVGVRVVNRSFANIKNCISLFNEVNTFLVKNDHSFPKVEILDEDLIVENNYFGVEYARFTRESVDAVNILNKTDGLKLEATYSGKAMAACIGFCSKEENKDKNILFWNTYNIKDLSEEVVYEDYTKLPPDFWSYFESDVQELDKDL